MSMVIDETKLNSAMTATADAIRAKTGDSAQIPFDYNGGTGFAEAVEAIPQGGGSKYELLDILNYGKFEHFKYTHVGTVISTFPWGGNAIPSFTYTLKFFSYKGARMQGNSWSFNGCTRIKYINISPNSYNIQALALNNTRELKALVLGKSLSSGNDPVILANTNAFQNSSIKDGTGYVYVPDDLLNRYKTASNWLTFASQIRGYSEAPAYDSATTYEIGDVCKYNGKFYGYCKEDLTPSTGNAPSGTTDDNVYWEYVGELEA